MIPRKLLGTASVPGSRVTLQLYQSGDLFSIKIPGRGETDMQRAAKVLEELRRRFADPSRPQLELDYIDRLLRGE